jgi:hypothetical protein
LLYPNRYSIKYINFSGEEDGLRGSQNYVSTVVNNSSPKMDIKVVFNLDEVGGLLEQISSTITCEDTASPTSNNAASVVTNQHTMRAASYALQTFVSISLARRIIFRFNLMEKLLQLFETNEATSLHTATDLLANMDICL